MDMKNVIDAIANAINNDKTISITIVCGNGGFAVISTSDANDMRITDHCSLRTGNMIIDLYDTEQINYDQEEDTYIMKKGDAEIHLSFY